MYAGFQLTYILYLTHKKYIDFLSDHFLTLVLYCVLIKIYTPSPITPSLTSA